MRQQCPECGASWEGEQTCQDHFHHMLFWENENPTSGAEVHHLMVLSYYLQHPSLYSPEGLDEARRLLTGFLEGGPPPLKSGSVIGSDSTRASVSGKLREQPPHPVHTTLQSAGP